jgi:hypothetical protein
MTSSQGTSSKMQKSYWQIAVVVSACRFNAMAMKKIEYSFQKLTLSPRMCLSTSHKIIVYEIKKQLVL